jgi:hypothetical protein
MPALRDSRGWRRGPTVEPPPSGDRAGGDHWRLPRRYGGEPGGEVTAALGPVLTERAVVRLVAIHWPILRLRR